MFILIVSSVKEGLQKLDELSKQEEELQKKKADEFRKMQADIRKGKGTGDKIRDFFILGGMLDETDLEKKVRALSDDIARHKDEPVLVISTRKANHGCTGFGGRGFEGIDSTLRLGILGGPLGFDYDSHELVFPTKTHVTQTDRGGWNPFKSDIHLNILEWGHLGSPLELQSKPSGCFGSTLAVDGEHGCTVYAGKSLVETYFGFDKINFKVWTEIRKTSAKNAAEYLESAKPYPNIDYTRALNLLGAPVPDVFQKKYAKKMTELAASAIRGIMNAVVQIERNEEGLEGIFDKEKREDHERRIRDWKKNLADSVQNASNQEWMELDLKVSAGGVVIVPREYVETIADAYKLPKQ